MHRILQTAMAEFSYMLEKYFSITSILPTILIIAAVYAVFLSSILFFGAKVVSRKRWWKHKRKLVSFHPLYLIITLAVSYAGDILIRIPQTWDSKLYRVMSNFQYIMSFETNRQIFCSALGLADSTYNQSNLFGIALRLNDAQWLTVVEGASGFAWYFTKVADAIREITRLGDCHFTIKVSQQCWAAYIPCLLLTILAVELFRKGHKDEAVCFAIAAAFCVWLSFGGAIFTCTMFCVGQIVWKYLDMHLGTER